MLLHATTPHRAYFGEKDHQQFKVVEKMARDLLFGVEIVGCPTVREADGLAMSSRNAYLSEEEREAAPVLYRSLETAAAMAEGGERDPEKLVRAMRGVCEAQPLVGLEYAAVVDADTLEPLESLDGRAARAIVAARVGATRLIDNIELRSSRDPVGG
jgi:pantoate--beta-alanine ligase